MTWLRIDDGMVDHRKWAALESDPRTWAECLAVWVALASYCQRTLSDGHVPESRLARLTPLGPKAKARCDDLVRVGLMDRVEDGYLFHDWLVYQASREKVEERREAKTRRQDRWRKSDGSFGDARVDASTRASHDASRDAPVEPAPSHPIPSHPIQRSSSARDARAPEARPVAVPAADPDPVESALRASYGRRYQASAGDAWMSHARDLPSIQRAAAWCRAQPSPMEAAERLLDGAFAHQPWRAQRWPWKWLAEDPALTASRSSIAVGAMGTHATLDEAMAAKLDRIPTIDLEAAALIPY